MVLRWRIEELENELQKTERSFKDQVTMLPCSPEVLRALLQVVMMSP